MTRWGDNALYRGVLAGFITLGLGSCVASPILMMVSGQTIDPPMIAAGVWIAAITLGVLIGYLSRRLDQPRRWAAEGKCTTCGYDLTGNVSGTCPECGTKLKKGG